MAVTPQSWSITSASNQNTDGTSATDIRENNLPRTLNNWGRDVMAGVAMLREAASGKKVSAGTADVQTLTTGLALASYATMPAIAFEAGAGLTNTGSATMAIDGLAAKTLKRPGGANLSAGDITAGSIYELRYESTADVLFLLNPTPSAVLVGYVNTANSPNANEMARFTDADTIEGLTYAETRAALDLEAGTDFYSISAADAAIAAVISDTAYDATSWNGVTTIAPSKNAVRDKIEALAASISFTDPVITGTILEDVYTISDGAAFEIDPGNGSIQIITLGASRTPLATNFAAGESVTMMIVDGTAYTITWSGVGVVWVGGSAPTLATSGYTVVELWKVASTIYGARVGDVA